MRNKKEAKTAVPPVLAAVIIWEGGGNMDRKSTNVVPLRPSTGVSEGEATVVARPLTDGEGKKTGNVRIVSSGFGQRKENTGIRCLAA